MVVFATVLTTTALALSVVYLATASHARTVRARAPQHPDVAVDELDSYDLALLTAGTSRAGEVALAELYLTGDVEVDRGGRLGWHERGSTDGSPHRVVRLAADKARKVDFAENSANAAVVVTAVRRQWQATAEMTRLRQAGLVLRAGALFASSGWRTAATVVQTVVVVPLGLACVMAVASLSDHPMLRESGLNGAPMYFALVGTGIALLTVHSRLGAVSAVVTMVVIFSGSLALGAEFRLFFLAALVVCLVWLAVYGVYVVTGRSLGTRTPAGDVLLAQERAQLAHASAHSDHDLALRAVALYGLAGVRRRLGRAALPHASGALPKVGKLARRVGAVHRRSAGTHADGGAGGSFGDNGSASGFPGGDGSVGGGDGGGGGDGSGDGGGGGGDGGGGSG